MFNYTSNLFNNSIISPYRIPCQFIPYKFQFTLTLKVPYKGAISTNTKIEKGSDQNTTALYEHVSSNDKNKIPELYIN